MPLLRITVSALLIALTASAAHAAERKKWACLDKDAQRQAVAEQRALPLAQVLKTMKPRHKGELVRARLCQGPDGLVYMLTLLARSGKVTRATVDANSGNVKSGG